MKGAALLLVSAIATGFGTQYDNHWPPARWQRLGKTAVMFAASQREVDRYCGRAPNGLTTEGCTTDKNVIVLPNPCTFAHGDEYARIACHEAAHRFGQWPEDHPL